MNKSAKLSMLQGKDYVLMATTAYIVYHYYNDISILSLLLLALTMYIGLLATVTDSDVVARDWVANFYLQAGKFFIIVAFIAACVAVVRMRMHVIATLL